MSNMTGHTGRTITKTEELAPLLHLNEDDAQKLTAISERYPFCIPEYYLNLIDWNDRKIPFSGCPFLPLKRPI